MKWVWLLLALILGAIAGAGWLLDPGYVLVRISDMVLETSLAVATLMLAGCVFVCFWLAQLLKRVLKSTARFADWQHSKSLLAQYELQKQAMVAVLGGDWHQSAAVLARDTRASSSGSDAQQQFMHTVLAAHTAHARGEFLERDKIWLASNGTVEQLPSLGPLLRAQWYLESGEIKQAIDPLNRILATNKKNGRALSMLASVHIALEDWEAAEACWSSLKKSAQPYHTGVRLNAYDFQRQQDFCNPILADALMLAKLLARRGSTIKEFKGLASLQRRNVDLLRAWGNELQVLQRSSEGADVLAAALDESWQSELFAQWLDLVIVAPAEHIERALGWAKTRPQDARIQEGLGMFASRSEQWQDAKIYFEAALKVLPEKDFAKARLYRQLALVWQALGDDHRALQYFVQAQALATH